MPQHIPTSTQWVSFPTDPRYAMTVKWWEGRRERSATYYSSKCYWGSLASAVDGHMAPKREIGAYGSPKPVYNTNEKLKVQGETVIYIAAEFVELEYQDGPLSDYHIKSLSGYQERKKTPKWINMQLTECFRYGQTKNDGQLYRWLVYHPRISVGIPWPKMFQHRFTSTFVKDLEKMHIDKIPGIGDGPNQAIQLSTHAIKLGSKIVYTTAGHFLHSFLNEEGVKEAEALQKGIDKEENKDVATEVKRMLCLQKTEAIKSSKINKETDADASNRAKRELEYLEDIEKGAVKKKSWILSLFGTSSKEKKSPEELKDEVADEANRNVQNTEKDQNHDLDEEIIQVCLPPDKRDASFSFQAVQPPVQQNTKDDVSKLAPNEAVAESIPDSMENKPVMARQLLGGAPPGSLLKNQTLGESQSLPTINGSTLIQNNQIKNVSQAGGKKVLNEIDIPQEQENTGPSYVQTQRKVLLGNRKLPLRENNVSSTFPSIQGKAGTKR